MTNNILIVDYIISILMYVCLSYRKYVVRNREKREEMKLMKLSLIKDAPNDSK